MWNITSNNIQRAKDQLQLRRAEIETRYAEENQTLDAEFAVIETLERAASEFMLKLNRADGATASGPTAPTDPPGDDEQETSGAIVEEASQPAAPIDAAGDGEIGSSLEGFAPFPAPEIAPLGGGEISGSLDILKPGSRWRLYRGSRTTESEGIAGEASPSTG
jgi:hypothetical protein